MTVTDRNPSVIITSDETLPEVIDRMRGAASGGRTVDLVVPIDSSLLLTASEFRALKDIIDERRLSVVVRTADPLRLRLGDRLGIRVQAISRPMPAAKPLESPNAAPPLAFILDPVIQDATNGDTIDAEFPRLAPESNWPILDVAEDDTAANGSGDAAAEAMVAPGPANPPRRWLPAALLLALLVAGAFLAIRFVVPGAVIRVTPKSVPVAASLLFDVTADGQPIDGEAAFALAMSRQTLEVVWEGSAPASGVRIEPDGTAAGAIELRNAAAEPMNVDAGTVVTTETGVEFSFVESVSVPAADAATAEPGATTGSVRAVVPGTGGNVETGEIGGRLPNGVYFSNRMEPTTGGTDKEYTVVAQADLDALAARARDAADELAQDVLSGEDAQDALQVTSVTIEQQQDAFDRQVNEDAEQVAVRSTLTIEATTFDEAAAAAEFESALARLLGNMAPEGYAVATSDIAFAAPVETMTDDRGVRITVEATADARAMLDEGELDALALTLVGASAEEAAEILARTPDIADFTVDYSPAWLPKQMPNRAGRIEIEIAP